MCVCCVWTSCGHASKGALPVCVSVCVSVCVCECVLCVDELRSRKYTKVSGHCLCV